MNSGHGALGMPGLSNSKQGYIYTHILPLYKHIHYVLTYMECLVDLIAILKK